MRRAIRTTLSLLVCMMMILTQFAFAFDEADLAGGNAADSAAAAEEGRNEEAGNGKGSEPAETVTPEPEEKKDRASFAADKNMSMKAIPGETVNEPVNMNAEEKKTVNFTISGGPVFGPQNGTASIEGCVVTNTANNNRNGGVTDSTGSAFISMTDGKLLFDRTTINTGNKSLVINIWASASAELKDSTLNGADSEGTAFDREGVPFLLIGGYPKGGGGILDISGNSAINGMKKTSVVGGNNSSVINVKDGTLTIKDSSIALKDGVRFVVKSGASLVLDNTELDVTDSSAVTAITVEEGGALKILNGSAIKATEAGSFDKGIIVSSGSVTISGSSVSGINKTSGNSSIIEIKKGDLTITGSTFENNKTPNATGGVILANKAGTISIRGESSFKNNSSGNSPVYVGECEALEISGKAAFSGNTARMADNKKSYGGAVWAYKTKVTIGDGVSFTGNMASFGGAVYLEECGETTIGKATFTENGSRFPDESEDNNDNNKLYENAFTQDGGALYIKKGKATLNGTVFEKNLAAVYGTSSGGAVYINGAEEVLVNGAKFKNNTAQTYGGAMTVAHDSHVEIGDLDDVPTEFKGNLVEYGYDQAGGALFINKAYVKMSDAAIYGNAADDAGGGLSTCTTGTAEVRILHGAAIFDNKILGGYHDKSRFFPPTEDIQNYKDVFFQTTDHLDADSGEDISGRDGFPAYTYELYERMFNGGLHKWRVKPVRTSNNQGNKLNSLVAQSDPTSKDVTGAKVIFTENQAWKHPQLTYDSTVSGGAIGCNGLLEIGTNTEIKLVKNWDDGSDADKIRPDFKEFVSEIRIWKEGEPEGKYIKLPEVTPATEDGSQPAASGYDEESGIRVDVFTDGSFAASGNVALTEPDGTIIAGADKWVIVISGLETLDEGEVYDCREAEILGYKGVLDETTDHERCYFEMTNSHEPADPVSVSVEKKWEGDEGKTRPENITVDLLADGKKIDSKELSSENSWKWIFSGLPKYKGKDIPDKQTKEEIDYQIVENTPDNYISQIQETTTETGDPLFKVNNIYKEGYTSIYVSKHWDDEENQDKYRPDKITVELLKSVGGGAYESTGKTLELTAAENWKPVEFTDLPLTEGDKIISYKIKELEVEHYQRIIKQENHFFEVTNIHVPETMNLSGRKVWDDGSNKDRIRPGSIVLKIYRQIEGGEKELYKTVTVHPDHDSNPDEWTWTVHQLPKDHDGLPIEYSVEEVSVEGYKSSIEMVPDTGIVITNRHTPASGGGTGSEDADDTDKDGRSKGVRTGDSNFMILWIAIAAAAAAGMITMILRRRKSR